MIPYDRHHWLGHLFTLRGSVIPHIAGRVGLVFAVAVGVSWAHRQGLALSIPLAAHTVIGTTLGLLLAFRTNTGYERFWEGRKAWGAIVNRTRNLARQALTSPDQALARRLPPLAIAFAHAAKHELRGSDAHPDLDRLLGPEEATALQGAPGPAQRCLLAMGQAVSASRAAGHLEGMDQHRLEADITTLIDQLGVCQRIQRTPIPFAYVLHLRRLLGLFCVTLPFALVQSLGWETPLVVLLVSYGLFGVEQIGVEIEDPFERTLNDIDLDAIVRAIEGDLGAIGRPITDAVSVGGG